MGTLIEQFLFERHVSGSKQRRRQPQRQAVTRNKHGHIVIGKRKPRGTGRRANGKIITRSEHERRKRAAQNREKHLKSVRYKIIRNRLRTFKHRKVHNLDRKRIAGHHK